tara:strand:- start:16630 stop:17853 length:1224 start_codon:yes stop_codon:yes gene_type:complete
MIYGSVCSGIEAASMAWQPLGWTPAFFSEIDKFPSAVLAHHHGSNMPGDEVTGNGVPNYGDMTKFEGWPDHAIDVLVGGTPCQDYSLAGNRLGMAGARGSLTLDYIKIAARYRPRYFVWENVCGVLSSNDGKDFARFLGDFSGTSIEAPADGWKNAGIIQGDANAYGLAYRVLDAQFVRVDGFGRAVPQRRRRVFVVGYLGDYRRAAAVLFDGESMSGNSAPSRKKEKGLAGKPEGSPDLTCARMTAFGEYVEDGTASTVKARDYKDATDLIAFNSREDPEVTFDRSGPLGASLPQAQAVAFDLRGRDGGAQFEGPHMTANIRAASRGSSHSYVCDRVVRRLIPVECERLQGFPDNHTQISWGGKPADQCPDGHRYKALGNTMAINCMRVIGRRIEMVEKISKEGLI